MNQELTEEYLSLLKDIVSRRAPEDIHLIDSMLSGKASDSEVGRLCSIINDEFMMVGIDENFEANEEGRRLEKILNIVNRPRIKSEQL